MGEASIAPALPMTINTQTYTSNGSNTHGIPLRQFYESPASFTRHASVPEEYM